jgi:hypothetical protein
LFVSTHCKGILVKEICIMVQKRGRSLAMETSLLKDRVLEPPRSPSPGAQMEEMLQPENRLPNTEGAPEFFPPTSRHDEEDPEIPPSCDLHMEGRVEGIPATLGPIQKPPRLGESDDERIYEGSLYPLKQLLNARTF